MEGVYQLELVNETPGYQEAAAQGQVTAVNAARHSAELEAWVLHRHASYIGVLIDSIVLHGVSEPYRMFTSRVDDRTAVREDNANRLLTRTGRELGIAPDHRLLAFGLKSNTISSHHHSARRAVRIQQDVDIRLRWVSGEQFCKIYHARRAALTLCARISASAAVSMRVLT